MNKFIVISRKPKFKIVHRCEQTNSEIREALGTETIVGTPQSVGEILKDIENDVYEDHLDVRMIKGYDIEGFIKNFT